ncbi:MAG: zinc-binding dehydrogenase, partial [Sciscionella sp.]|nr:zinc-binding dehydrogenase [Sciscionella sp.]
FGSLQALAVTEGGTLLVRGGSSSVGMAALSLATGQNLRTIATTRDSAKAQRLRDAGADHVVIDRGDIADDVRAIVPAGPDYVLDLVGTDTLEHSLRLVARGGIVCLTGSLASSWTIEEFEPMVTIPSSTRLTTFHSDTMQGAAGASALRHIVDGVAAGRYRANIDRVFRLTDIVDAHHYLEDNRAAGKVVVLT